MTRLTGRACIAAIVAVLAAALPSTAAAHDPILFVHGWNSNSSTWTTMVNRFAADGWTAAELNNWSYNTSQSNATTAGQIQTKVDQILAATGAPKVDLISHSMGGLSTRYYVKNLGGGAKVDEWVSLGGPNHGTNTANYCFSTACSEMRIGSTFLNNLNAGDETPGTTVNWLTWWSPCDDVINPDSSVALSGATNRQTACLSHSALHEDATVYAQVRDAVR
jgi:triacylglycerol esterase/lipase EstA (alpha/beta hydrolase family)